MTRSASQGKALPEGWREARLGDICVIKRGGSPRPIQNYLTKSERGINWLRIGDVSPQSKYIFETKEKIIAEGVKKSILVKEGDFILSNSMSYGRPYIMKTTTCVHDGWLILSDIKEIVYKEYLYYALLDSKIQNTFKSISAGSGVRNLKKESVSLMQLILPSLPEQKAIASLLEKWDTAIEKTETLIAAKEKKFKWLLKTLINDQRNNSKWPKTQLGDLFGDQLKIEKGVMLTKKEMTRGNYPVVAGGQTFAAFHNKFTHPGKAITISSSGAYAGFIWFHDYPIFATDCNVITASTGVTKYFYYAIKMQQTKLFSLQSGGAQPHIYAKDIAMLDVFIPPLTKQKSISGVLDKAQAEIDLLKNLSEKYQIQKRGLMQKTLTGGWLVK